MRVLLFLPSIRLLLLFSSITSFSIYCKVSTSEAHHISYHSQAVRHRTLLFTFLIPSLLADFNFEEVSGIPQPETKPQRMMKSMHEL